MNKTFALDHLTPEQARELMEAVLGTDVAAAEAGTAAKLAQRCAYNPLALEIAARRIRQLEGVKKPLARYFEIAQARFSELVMDGDARWDMTRIFDISYADLSAADQQRFRALAAFHPTGFAPEAAAFVWDQPGRRPAGAFALHQPVAGKMVPGESERYRLHDLLDEYASQKLHQNREEEIRVRNALAEWLIRLFSEHYTDDRSTAPQVAEERANLLHSCGWARGQKEGILLARLITQSRNWFYVSFTEDWIYWIAWLEASLKLGLPDAQLKANVLQAIGDVQQFRKEMDAALASYSEALKLFRAVGDRLGEANVLKAIGDVQQFRDERDAALASYSEALKLFRAVGSKLGEANCIQALGDVHTRLSELPEARARYEEALPLYRSIGDKLGEANTLSAMMRLNFAGSKDIAVAERELSEIIQIRQRIGDAYGEASDCGNFAIALLKAGQKPLAKKYFLHTREIFIRIGVQPAVKMTDEYLAACDEQKR
ncbi:MAG: hypothetical protein C0393_05310 [Anaerolinea sp.]|nr:hypothetical protein [Anaerolinea sp.]